MKKLLAYIASALVIVFIVCMWRELTPSTPTTILGTWSAFARIVARFVDSLFA